MVSVPAMPISIPVAPIPVELHPAMDLLGQILQVLGLNADDHVSFLGRERKGLAKVSASHRLRRILQQRSAESTVDGCGTEQ